MEPTLFSFIWKHSKRQQIWLLVLTVVSFPFLYISLELPKRIINDAIGAESPRIEVLGIGMDQGQYLLLLCLAFLAAVVASGLMKMHLNTRKGILSERMLRRLRYELIARMMRFPRPYFRTTSQGELVSMITAESEPMGGLMGDAVAQPVFQFGQMMTIVVFLFLQSPWFGLASVALIPLQAWLIPRLQRRINLMNKDRIVELRHLSAEIGETAAGISDLRANGGVRYRLAQITDRLGRMFEVRFRIYQAKFFMKFINNFIGQLTPFFFYLVGGWLAIRGDITVGALVAALAAYKDLSSPWKELLTYYNQVQDMSLRWSVVTEKFAPDGMIPEALFKGQPERIPHLDGPIELRDVTVRDQDGNTVLEDVSLTIPPGARVAVQAKRPAERAAFALLLTREVQPSRGQVLMSGQPLNGLHQSVIAARIGHAHSQPYLFDGSIGDNLMMPLRVRPQSARSASFLRDRSAIEAVRAGNSPDPLDVDWLDPDLTGPGGEEAIRHWWFQLAEALGTDEAMFRRTLRSRFDPALHPDLAAAVVALRPEINLRLRQSGLCAHLHTFDPDQFNPAVPLGGNLLYAAAARDISQQQLVEQRGILNALEELGLTEDTLAISQGVMETLNRTFGRDGTDHPLFRRLGLDASVYGKLSDIAQCRALHGDGKMTEADKLLFLTVPFLLTAEQIGPEFPREFQDRILDIRRNQAAALRSRAGGLFQPIDPDEYAARLTVIENAIYGRVSLLAGAHADAIEDVVAEVLTRADLRRPLAAIIFDQQAGLGGANLPTAVQERAAFNRAAIKRPDILLLDRAMASQDSDSRMRTRQRLRDLLPRTTLIFMEDQFANPDAYDLFIRIENGRIDGVTRSPAAQAEAEGAGDLGRKLRAIARADLFAGLDARNQRLLAFGARWYSAAAGQMIFAAGQVPDAAYLCLQGRAELRVPESAPQDPPVSVIEPGRLIGDLSVITRAPRTLNLVALEDCRFLRLGAEEFRAVIEADPRVSMQLLETVAGHLTDLAEILRLSKVDLGKLLAAADEFDSGLPPAPTALPSQGLPH